MAHPITDAAQARSFMLAGSARFTLRSRTTGKHFTYRVRRAEQGDVWFCSLLTDGNNEGAFTYLGMIRGGALPITTAKSKFKADSAPFKALRWTMSHLAAGAVPAALEIWHEGRCGRCARTLTDPVSVATGIGPECRKHH